MGFLRRAKNSFPKIAGRNMKKIKVLSILFLIAVCALCCFTGCGSTEGQYDGIEVVYNLCGGKYKNGEDKVSVYYSFPSGAKKLIKGLPVAANSTDKPVNTGYELEGWYKDENYTEEWSFASDEVTESGVTLYAKWRPLVEYYYDIGYKNESGEFVSLTAVEAYTSWTFEMSADDIKKAADGAREGYTFLGKLAVDEDDHAKYFDTDGKLAVSTENVAIKVYAEYIEGNYLIVSSADDMLSGGALNKAENRYKDKTVLLMNDIDFAGKNAGTYIRDMFAPKSDSDSTPKYVGIKSYDPEGTGVKYSLKNFAVTCSPEGMMKQPVTASIFAAIEGGSGNEIKISDVNFEGVTVNVDAGNPNTTAVYVSSFATTLKHAEITGVTVEMTVNVTRLKNGMPFYKAENDYAREAESVTENGNSFVITSVKDASGNEITLASQTED